MKPFTVSAFRIPGPVNDSPCRNCPKAANNWPFAVKAGAPAEGCPLPRKLLGLPA